MHLCDRIVLRDGMQMLRPYGIGAAAGIDRGRYGRTGKAKRRITPHVQKSGLRAFNKRGILFPRALYAIPGFACPASCVGAARTENPPRGQARVGFLYE